GRPYAMGLSIADDAMLSLLEPMENAPSAVLYNPERKVMATTGAQILTWRVVQKTWGPGNELYAIARPPVAFRRGGLAPQPLSATTTATTTASAKKPDVTISIRTDFSATSTWIPEAIVDADKDGKGNARFEAKLPDGIAKQRVTLVATDDRGAIGVGTAT